MAATKKKLLFLVVMNLTFTSGFSQSLNINGPSGSGQFGFSITILANGNYVVADPYYDNGAIVDAGAVYLYDGSTHALISALKGSTANDNVGSGGIVALSNGNYVVRSTLWDNGAVVNAGAVTWGSGTTGVSGVVSSANSLVGSTANDGIGNVSIVALSNGNYVVSSSNWDNGAAVNAGAVTWGNGSTGITGLVSSSNSLVGSTSNNQVGKGGIIVLTNSNYVVNSYDWDNGAVTNVGAATWCNGTGGTNGIVSSSNSLIGSTVFDNVGYAGAITPLVNGNYVVITSTWDNGSIGDAGAVTWGSGTTGISGTISSANSLVGSKLNDQLGYNGVWPLTNGNYVVCSGYWDNGAVADVGAATWANGTTGVNGVISSSNSLIGDATSNFVGQGGVIALANGNYVVESYDWDNGAITNVGAATWGNGASGITGVVSSSNSLIGSTANDKAGNGGVYALTNGNYVVRTASWDNGAIVDAGAVTWGNGVSGATGLISSSNSLVGSTANDQIGSYGVIVLSNGNYVVESINWDNGAVVNAGAATWGNGTSGITGVINSSNSLVGSTANDQIGNTFALATGNYVVSNSSWDNGALTDVGAVTWGNGITGVTGVINSSNSLVGSSANNLVGNGAPTALSNGNYIVRSFNWDNGALTDVGAVTWGDGSTGIAGAVSSSNSIIGSTANDNVGNGGVIAFSNGNYYVLSSNWDNGAASNAGAVTSGNNSYAVVGSINSCNSVMGSVAAGGSSIRAAYNSVYNNIIVNRPAENIVTIYYPSGMSLANTLDLTSVNINGSNEIPLIASGGCRIIATVQSSGVNPLSGNVNAKLWVESSVPTYAGQPFVARHYEITPVTNPASATGRVTLYFLQQEFNDFNAHSGSINDLPTGPSDAVGKANLRIGKYAGTSNNGSGLPGTYSSGATILDPNDADIVWNSILSRWEISFDVTGFSGFVVQTSTSLLPLTILEFNGRLLNGNALLKWRTENELNADKFLIKRSVDGRTYTIIGTVNALNRPGNNSYSFTDPAIASLGVPVIYYRLQQKDIDSSFVYSKIVALSLEKKNLLLLYPNPATNDIILTITTNRPEKLQLRIIDNAGHIVQQQQLYTIPVSAAMTIDISDLAKGVYYLELNGEIMNERKKFVKQ